MTNDIERVLITQEELQESIKKLGERIAEDYRGKNLLIVGILKGAFVFMADLARHINLPLEMDFMAIKSYGSSSKSSGVVQIIKDLDSDISGKDILIIEDIADSGHTLSYLSSSLMNKNAASVAICVLLDKKERREKEVKIDYCVSEIPNEFIVGYGLDYAGKYRNLPYIGILKREVYM